MCELRAKQLLSTNSAEERLHSRGNDRELHPYQLGDPCFRTARRVLHHSCGAQLNRDDIVASVAALGDLVQVVRNADPADKADIYTQLGMALTYRPESRLVEATVRPPAHMCKEFVSEAGLEPACPVKGTSTSS